jgi:spore germination cell wall hydrolase CwlJ-like protein
MMRRTPRLHLIVAVVAAVLIMASLLGFGQRLLIGDGAAQATVLLDGEPISAARQNELIEATRGPLAEVKAEGAQAQEINAALPFSKAPIEKAAAFSLAAAGASDRERAELCLTQAVYYEAGFEPVAGRRAVAQVVLNRLRHPAFAKTVCGVVYEGSSAPGCQFSFTCDGSLARRPAAAAWAQAAAIAREALGGHVDAAVGEATHYHANYVAPYWAPKLTKLVQVGQHIFYRWPGGWGRKGAFNGRYAGGEAIGRVMLAADTEPQVSGILPQAADERRAPDDVGGRLDVSKGWTLSIPDPTETRGAQSRAAAAQKEDQFAAVQSAGGGQ